MATFDEFYSSLDSDPGIRGKQFEKFVKWFLKNDPVWASQVKDIWLWDEHPKRSEWGPDCGIDLVFEDFQNKTWAVQAKCFAPQSSIKKQDMDSFISASDSRFQRRLLVASTDRIGQNAERVLVNQKVIRFLLDDFRNSEIIFPQSLKDLSQGKRKKRKEPRPHQLKAIDAVFEGFNNSNRGQLLMACGTGKTLTSLWIKERLGAEEVLVLLPSLSLLSQTLKEWISNAKKPFKWICVCSDYTVAKKDEITEDWLKNTSEIGIPVTSEIKDIEKFLKEEGSKVVFSTYQSSPLVVKAQEKTLAFDIVFADEAHRCAGTVSQAFGNILEETKIKTNKRLFLTGTPRVISKRIKKRAEDENIEINSMDDEEIFGKVFHNLKFSEAIKNDLLTDYQVVVIGIDNKTIKKYITNRTLFNLKDNHSIDAETLASNIALIKAIKDYSLKRIISFHGTIKKAKDFSENIQKIYNLLPEEKIPDLEILSESVSGNMKSYERNEKIQRLRNVHKGESRLLTNARCLSEGVDVPTLDGIAFIDPKSSQIDIIQAVGRAIRRSEDKSVGTIIIPIFIDQTEDVEDKLFKSRFKNIWQVILALKSQDDLLMEEIDQYRMQLGSIKTNNQNFSFLNKLIIDLPKEINSEFSLSIKTLLIRETTDSWLENFGKLKLFVEKNNHASPKRETKLGTWVIHQREIYKSGKMIKDRLKLLESIKSWIWDTHIEYWNLRTNELQEYLAQHGNLEIVQTTPLGRWMSTQRSNYQAGILPQDKVDYLESFKEWYWDYNLYLWQKRLNELIEYEKENKSTRPPRDLQVGKWVSQQRLNYKKGNLSNERINELEKVNRWAWTAEEAEELEDPIENKWMQRYKEINEYLTNNKSLPTYRESSLGVWVSEQRKLFRNEKLHHQKIKLLEKIKIWEWEIKSQTGGYGNQDWKTMYSKLVEFCTKNNRLPSRSDDQSISYWKEKQRKLYKSKELDKNKIDLLEKIEDWEWDYEKELQKEWEKNRLELKEFIKKNERLPKSREPLGKWVGLQRDQFKKNSISSKRIKLLEEIKEWVWKVK